MACSYAIIDTSTEILQGYSISCRSTVLGLDVEPSTKDIKASRAKVRSELETWMEWRQLGSPGKISKRNLRPGFFIIVDDTVSSMIHEIMLHNSSLRNSMCGLVILQDNRSRNPDRQDNGKLHHNFLRKNSRLKEDIIEKRSWRCNVDQSTFRTDYNRKELTGPLEERIEMAISYLKEARGLQSEFPSVPEKRKQGSRTKVYSNHLHKQSSRPGVLGNPLLQKSLVAEAPASKGHAPLETGEWEGKTRFWHLRDHAEACLSNGDLKHALIAFQRCLKMEIPWFDARWEITGSLAVVKMGLGQYVEAEEELRKLLENITSTRLDEKDREIAANVQRETAFRHALALSRLEKHKEALDCLSGIQVPAESDQTSFQVGEGLMLQAKISRLKALSRAYLGFQDLRDLKSDLMEADRCCRGLSDVLPPDVERAGRANMFKHRWAEISTSLNKSRVIMLQGDYKTALQILQPALQDAVLKIGETDVLTLEATLLSCHLHILTGQVRLGRQSCERCANVIMEALGPEHNLALEAEYLLIAADQAEGFLTLALDDSLALCHRAKSRADFGHKHPATLRYRSQLGGLHLQRGNYLEAESILESAWVDSEDAWPPKHHPNSLRIQAQLALARYHQGKLIMAERNIRTALRGQLKTYLQMKETNNWLEHDSEDGLFKKMPFVLERLKGIYSAPRSELNDEMPHLDILVSLLTLGKVLSKKQVPNLDLVLKIFWLVLVSANEQLGQSHELSLAASLAMGEVFSGRARMESDDTEQQRKYFLKAASYYNSVMSPGSSINGPDDLPDAWNGDYEVAESSPIMKQLEQHRPTVLHARQEFLVVSILGFDDMVNDINYVQSCKQELEFILAAQQSRLGWNHPHRLKTLFSLLALQVGLDEPAEQVLQTQEELMGRLRREDVRRQRYLECLLMEETVAGVLYGRLDLREKCRMVAEGIGIAVGEWRPIDSSLQDAAKRIKDRNEAMLCSLLET